MSMMRRLQSIIHAIGGHMQSLIVLKEVDCVGLHRQSGIHAQEI